MLVGSIKISKGTTICTCWALSFSMDHNALKLSWNDACEQSERCPRERLYCEESMWKNEEEEHPKYPLLQVVYNARWCGGVCYCTGLQHSTRCLPTTPSVKRTTRRHVLDPTIPRGHSWLDTIWQTHARRANWPSPLLSPFLPVWQEVPGRIRRPYSFWHLLSVKFPLF